MTGSTHFIRYTTLPLLTLVTGCATWESQSEDDLKLFDEAPPALTLELPIDGTLYDASEEVRLVGTASDVLTAWENLIVTADSDRDGSLVTTNPGTDGRFDVAVPVISEGAHNLTVTAIDEAGLQTSTTVTFAWGQNLAPSAPEIAISPDEAEYDDSIAVVIVTESVDPEGDAVTYSYTWSVDGVVQEDFQGDTVAEGNLFKDQVWTVSVVATDGVNDSEPATAEITISDAFPEASVAITPENPTVTDTLFCSYEATDPDGDPILTTDLKWSVNGTFKQDASQPFAGQFAEDDVVRCLAKASSISGTTEAFDEVTILPGNGGGGGGGMPTIQSATISVSPVSKTSTNIGCTVVANDPDGDPLTTIINWYVNGILEAPATSLADPAIFSKGDELMCGAVVSDGFNTSSEFFSGVEIVENSPPTSVSTVSISPGTPAVGDALTCNLGGVSTDPDGDPITYEYYWFINSTRDKSQDQLAVIDSSSYAVGDSIQCATRPNDGTINGFATYSSAVVLAVGGTSTYGPGDVDLAVFGTSNNAHLGRAVTNMGDMDGDGADELGITGYGYNSNAGRAMVFLGSTITGTTSNLSESDATGNWSGEAASDYLGAGENIGAASVDGDGQNDIITAAHKNGSNDGKVYVLLTGDYLNWNTPYIDDAASFMVAGDNGSQQMVGYGFGAGDLDGDGSAEILVGAPRADSPANNAGQVGIFMGSTVSSASFGTTERLADSDYLITGAAAADSLGIGEITVLPDIDGDGFDELALGGSDMSNSNGSGVGSLFLVSGGDLANDTVDGAAFVEFEGSNANDDFGYAAASPGDLDGDGTADLVISARYGDENVTDAGAVYLYYGDSTWSGTVGVSDADASFGDDDADGLFGKHLVADGDYDGDGTNDLLIGANFYGSSKTGRAYVVSGAGHTSWTTGMDINDEALVLYEGANNDTAGVMSAFYDADGDGSLDLAIGAEGDDDGAPGGGSVLFLFSN
ncbi:MAG: hypothetical protein VXW32_11080 [Myxococcota bacterium]|nr:hypothetical protein [Myxococcota bacterium]